MPAAVWSALIPALEEDPDLGWSKQHSGIIMFSSMFCECLGLIFIGHLTDVFGGRSMLLTYMFLAAGCLLLFGIAHNVTVMHVVVAVVGFLGGLRWPAVTNLIGDSLPSSQWDLAFIMVGSASRFGDSFCAMTLGTLLHFFHWRYAIAIVALVVVVFAFTFNGVMDFRNQVCPPAVQSRARSSTESSERDVFASCKVLSEALSGLPGKVMLMSRNVDFWLMCFMVSGLSGLWTYAMYFAAFAHSIFGAPVPVAAQMDSAYSFGQFCGLLGGVAILSLSGEANGRRVLYMTSLIGLSVSIVIPLVLLFELTTQLWLFALLSYCLAMFTVQCCYVPSGVFAILEGGQVGGPGRDSSGHGSSTALLLGVIEGWTGMLGGFLTVFFGNVREQSDAQAFRVLCFCLSCGLLTSTIAFSLYCKRNWHGPLFNPLQDVKDNASDYDDAVSDSGLSSSTKETVHSAYSSSGVGHRLGRI
eukprot:gnl/MRDRNA2_/MRDRNA2_54027_c0_seq1.p1 gnl/MRDRNA2_/MRDRNA2_54027_c0~~gnl/MRDRNA2_/MRDRNA2_54027_c0_seq1.p1  ORF type:complete len:551 (-),score=60.80 gnl/MRDRNA2_/MRDRNA2_54027_c0_seq1:28-1440(-)